jgi:hypothetical protein
MLNILTIKEMQIKSTLRFYLTLGSMAIIKKTSSKCEDMRTLAVGTLIHCWWECKLVQALWKVVWRFLKKLKTELPYDPANHPWAYI